MALQGRDGLDQRHGPRQVAQAPPGHGVGLAEPVHGHCAVVDLLRQTGEAGRFNAVIDHLLIDLIRDHHKIVLARKGGNLLQLGRLVDRADRIGGTVQDQGTRPWRYGRLEAGPRHLEPVTFRRLHKDRLAPRNPHHLRVAQPERRRYQDLVARLQERHKNVEERMFGSAANHDL